MSVLIARKNMEKQKITRKQRKFDFSLKNKFKYINFIIIVN